jgi:BolA family transcriptional regulator, general stress-responsive regulator
MRTVLAAAFDGAEVSILDESHRHAGHAGAAPGGQTHYAVRVVSPAFAGMSRVARSRAVHAALEPEFGSGLHALSLRLQTPEEAGGAA